MSGSGGMESSAARSSPSPVSVSHLSQKYLTAISVPPHVAADLPAHPENSSEPTAPRHAVRIALLSGDRVGVPEGGEQITTTAACGDPLRSARRGSRRDALKLGALGAGALLLAGRGGAVAADRPSARQDVKILNFALVLERLQAAFYRESLERASLTGELLEFAETVGEHERAHVDFLEKALGDAAGPPPRLDLRAATQDAQAFGSTARVLEDTGVSAYNGQAANLTKKALGAAAEIVSVEGRHAAWIRDILGLPPAPRAADSGADSATIVRRLRASGLLT